MPRSRMSKRADKQLLRAVLEPRKDGALQEIVDACAAGADPDAVCPDTSTSSGPVRGGTTLLTHSIQQGASLAVEKLLACGADPNLADERGSTPWMASNLIEESKGRKIRELLERHGGKHEGTGVGELVRAVMDGNVEQMFKLLDSEQAVAALANLRVDPLRHQILNNNASALRLLLDRGMQGLPEHLTSAIKAGNAQAVDLLLTSGVAPEEQNDRETPLMFAAGMGAFEIVKRLVEAGADVDRTAHGNVEWDAAFSAAQAGHAEIAEWLRSRMSSGRIEALSRLGEARNPKFAELYAQATAGEGISTDDIAAALERWDQDVGIAALEATHNSLAIEFQRAPKDVDELLAEARELCPEVDGDRGSIEKDLVDNRRLFLWWD